MSRKKSTMRDAARQLLERRGYTTEIKTGRGLLPGARLIATKSGKMKLIGVRTTHDRALSLSRHRNGSWRTLDQVDTLLVVAPKQNEPNILEILEFEPKTVRQIFDRTLKAMRKRKLEPSLEMPVFVPLDHSSRKDVGHNITGLKDHALYTSYLTAEEITSSSSAGREAASWLEGVKREFAYRNGVDVSKVSVEFRIKDE